MNRFQRTRQDHSLETAEDYVELIDRLIREKGEARGVDLAARLSVSAVTVGKTIKRLAREGYVKAEPYRAIDLTPKGRRLAKKSAERHKTVLEFLHSIGVPDRAAETDAEGIEHHVSEQTLDAMRRYLKGRRP
ncbi:MAG TPA: manganese-binding transcriptional regulator MntR [Fimbriimonadaceae bacterium]|nr:manganese-binding transcriptional regulator MntR [Fimbriimonadaceae bacterium]